MRYKCRITVIGSILMLMGCAQSQPARLVPQEQRMLPANANALPDFDSLTPSTELPDLFTMLEGTPVKTPADWKVRREEIKRLFCHYVYGYAPPAPTNMSAVVEFSDRTYLDGKATLEQIKLSYGTDCVPPLHLLLVTPNKGGPKHPVFLGLNFHGNHTVTDHPAIPVPSVPGIHRQRVDKALPTEAGRGRMKNRWPMELMIDRGYAVATFFQGDISPDNPQEPEGVQTCYYAEGQTRRGPHDWGTLAAWAWGLSRAVDYLAACDRIDSATIAVTGHSRNGKASLLAGAMDERIALVVSNQSGCGGAALSRRDIGESVKVINDSFPHWFCDAFRQFNDREEFLPVDQHMLIALIAPRPVLICAAAEDIWADPEGQFLALKAALPAYRLLTGKEIQIGQMPAYGTITEGPAAYHIRAGGHDIGREDWLVFMDMADRCGFSK